MAEYIEREALIEKLKYKIPLSPYPPNEAVGGIIEAINTIYNQPTVDVVPKSEVERLEKQLDYMLVSEQTELHIPMEYVFRVRTEHPVYTAIKTEIAREIFEEIEKIATAEGAYDYVSIQEIAELKKKYKENKE